MGMKDILVTSITVIIAIVSMLLKSQKHSIEKKFDSQSEKAKHRLLYESLAILGVMFYAFFLTPIKAPSNIILYYIVYSIFVTLFVLTQTIEMLITIWEYKGRTLPRFVKIYKKNIFKFGMLQITFCSITLIIANVHMYTLFYDAFQEIGIINNTFAGLTVHFINEMTYKEILIILMILFLSISFYGIWRMLVSAPWYNIKKHFQKKTSLTIKLTSSETLSDLSFVNSSEEYFLCYDLNKQEYVLIYKNNIERIIIKELKKVDS